MNIDGVEPKITEDKKGLPCPTHLAIEHLDKLFKIVKANHCPSITTLKEIEGFLKANGKIL